jgi:hypothetical protein
VFDICKRHASFGCVALRDAPSGHGLGAGRSLAPGQEVLLRRQIIDSTPDDLAMPELLWNRAAVSRLIEQRLGIVMPARILALYLSRWGFAARRPKPQAEVAGAAPMNRWLSDRYPGFSAKSSAEGGEIAWAGARPRWPCCRRPRWRWT